MITIKTDLPANGMSHQANTHTHQQKLKIRSMACLMKPAQFKERPLSNQVKKDRFINGYVIHANIKNPGN